MKIKSKIKDYYLEFVDNALGKKGKLFSKLKYGVLFILLIRMYINYINKNWKDL